MLGRFLKYWLPLILWMVMIFGISTNLGASKHTSRIIGPILLWLIPTISPEALDLVHYCVRKAAHFCEYGILAILIWRVLRSEPKWIAARTLGMQLVLVVLLAALYAASDEFHQSFSSAREGRLRDVLIDTAGATCGALVFFGWIRWRKP